MKILYLDCFLGFDASMLLGALIDMGVDTKELEEHLRQEIPDASIDIEHTKRLSIECTRANARGTYDDNTETSLGTNELVKKAVYLALEQMNIEYIMCSDVGVCDITDGRALILLANSGIDATPIDTDIPTMHTADAQFLCQIVCECAPKPPMEIVSIGYGAGGTREDYPALLTAIIGHYNSSELFDMEIEEDIAILL